MTEELFSNPTVKAVVFQIRYPNLFFLEGRIGDFQVEIMERFPKSQLLIQQNVLIANMVSGAPPPKASIPPEETGANKIWRFDSPEGVVLNMQSDSLDLSSNAHKSYNHPDASIRFREVIEYVLQPFLKITKVPILTRVGLRYVDHCPIKRRTKAWFNSFYNTTLPLNRFTLEEAKVLQTTSLVRKGKFSFRFQETLQDLNGIPTLLMDFDGSATDVKSSEVMPTADSLHDLIDVEWQKSIKEGLKKMMRKSKDARND